MGHGLLSGRLFGYVPHETPNLRRYPLALGSRNMSRVSMVRALLRVLPTQLVSTHEPSGPRMLGVKFCGGQASGPVSHAAPR